MLVYEYNNKFVPATGLSQSCHVMHVIVLVKKIKMKYYMYYLEHTYQGCIGYTRK